MRRIFSSNARTVAEYEKKFMELVKYSLNLIELERQRCRHFERGLRQQVRTLVTTIST